jgi:hypothetical protein
MRERGWWLRIDPVIWFVPFLIAALHRPQRPAFGNDLEIRSSAGVKLVAGWGISMRRSGEFR